MLKAAEENRIKHATITEIMPYALSSAPTSIGRDAAEIQSAGSPCGSRWQPAGAVWTYAWAAAAFEYLGRALSRIRLVLLEAGDSVGV
jgi:hypothetical protein